MATPIQTLRQTIRVPGTTKVVVSARDASDTPGQRLRSLRIYTDDLAVPALEIQIEGDTDAAIAVPTPVGTF